MRIFVKFEGINLKKNEEKFYHFDRINLTFSEVSLRIPNRNIIKWWVSHIKNGEKTKYYFQYRFWIKPFIKSRWQKTYGTFKTDIFSRSVGACHMKK